MDVPLCHYSCQAGAARTEDVLWPGPSEVQGDFYKHKHTEDYKVTVELNSHYINHLLLF